MIKPLRKRHFQIWIACAILFLLFIFLSWKSIDQWPDSNKKDLSVKETHPKLQRRWAGNNYLAEWRTDSHGKDAILHWVNKGVLAYPSATIYFSSHEPFNIQHSTLIGRIEAKGSYSFTLDSAITSFRGPIGYFVVFDFIHDQVIDRLNLFP